MAGSSFTSLRGGHSTVLLACERSGAPTRWLSARVFAAKRSQGGGARRAPGDMSGAANTRVLEGEVDRFAALAMTG
jgi:hypothetical protein